MQLGIPLSELGDITVGEIMDIFIEKMNDDEEYESIEELSAGEALAFLGVC